MNNKTQNLIIHLICLFGGAVSLYLISWFVCQEGDVLKWQSQSRGLYVFFSLVWIVVSYVISINGELFEE